MENTPATMTVPLRTVAPQLEADLPLKRHHARHEGQQAQAHAQQPTTEQEVVPR
jgi:hypothetical protein